MRLERPLPEDAVLRRRSVATSSALLQRADALAPRAAGTALVRGAFHLYTQHNASGALEPLQVLRAFPREESLSSFSLLRGARAAAGAASPKIEPDITHERALPHIIRKETDIPRKETY